MKRPSLLPAVLALSASSSSLTGSEPVSTARYLANAGVLITAGDTQIAFDPIFRKDYGEYQPLPAETVQPSRATDFRHGFASISRFFPEGKALLAQLEEELWEELYGIGRTSYPLVFEDQYISTGGQIYELAVGHDRMLGDLRPLVFEKLGLVGSHACHPYDICTALVLMGYANSTLAAQVRPILKRLLEKHFGTGA